MKDYVGNCVILLILAIALPNHNVRSAEPGSDDWPQWGGPNRDHKSLATGFLRDWPESGPKLMWKFDRAGVAYSSPAVVGQRLYSMGADQGKNFAYCLDSTTGKEIWRTEIGNTPPSSSYRQGWGAGPRSTPTAINGRVIVLDDGGNCCNLDAISGEIKWKLNLVTDLKGQIPNWGYGESPLVDGNRVVVCPGGDEFLVALDFESGKKVLISSGFSEKPHYVSLVRHSVDGVAMYITAAESGLVGFSAETGKTLWKNSSTGNGTATIPTPIVAGNGVYHTSNYGAGCVLIDLKVLNGRVTVSESYANQVMQNHHGGVVLHDGNIFGYRKGGGWVCQDFKSGEMKWNKRFEGDSGASVAFADGRLYVYGESSGTCYLVEPSATEWKMHGQVVLPEQTKLDRRQGRIWSHPVIADGKLFLRDLDLIYAFDIRK